MRSSIVTTACVVGLLAASADASWALNLTGTWESPLKDKFSGAPLLKCVTFSNVKSKSFDPAQGKLEISQVGNDLYIRVGHGGSLEQYFIGNANADGITPTKGAAGVIACDTLQSRNIGMYLSSINDTTGTMKIETRGSIGTLYLHGGEAAACKGTLIRTSTANPNVPKCPAQGTCPEANATDLQTSCSAIQTPVGGDPACQNCCFNGDGADICGASCYAAAIVYGCSSQTINRACVDDINRSPCAAVCCP